MNKIRMTKEVAIPGVSIAIWKGWGFISLLLARGGFLSTFLPFPLFFSLDIPLLFLIKETLGGEECLLTFKDKREPFFLIFSPPPHLQISESFLHPTYPADLPISNCPWSGSACRNREGLLSQFPCKNNNDTTQPSTAPELWRFQITHNELLVVITGLSLQGWDSKPL